MAQDPFQDKDRAELERRGIPEDEARRQLALLADPPGTLRLVRPCTVGDGIETLPPERRAELDALHGEAAAAGRLSKFVPASGAASLSLSNGIRL